MNFQKITIQSVLLCAIILSVNGSAQTLETSSWVHHERQAPTRDITSIHQLPEGHFAAVTDSTMHVYDGVIWSKYLIPDILPDYTKPFFSDQAGRLYFYKSQSIYRWDATSPDKAVEVINTGRTLTPLQGAYSSDNTIYFGLANSTDGGIYQLEGSALNLIRTGQVRSFTIAADGVIWAIQKEPGATEYRLWAGSGEDWEDLTDAVGGITDLTRVFAAPDGSVWINNETDYTVYKNGSWDYFTGGLQTPRYLAFDASGSVWGISVGGTKMFQRNEDGNWITKWEYLIDNTTPYFLTSDQDGRVFIADGEEVLEYDESAITDSQKYPWREADNVFDLGSDMVTCMAYTDDGRLLCGHGMSSTSQDDQENAGLSIYDGETWTNYSMATNDVTTFRFSNVYALETLGNGDVMVSSNYAYNMVFDGSSWSYLDSLYTDAPSEFGWRYVNDYIQDEDEDLWVATTWGLLYHNYEDYPEIMFAPDEIGYEDYYNYRNLFVDRNNVVYFQNDWGIIISYDSGDTDRRWDIHYGASFLMRDFIIRDESGDPWVWGALQDGMYRVLDETIEPVIDTGTNQPIVLPNASLITIDEEDRTWASGYGNTGYLDDDNVWHHINALENTQATAHAFYYLEKIAFNATRLIRTADTETIDYMGVYTYDIDNQTVVEESPSAIDIARNYPNPFNASTTISFSLSKSGKTTVSVYSLNGQRIRTLTDRTLKPGAHQIRWDGRNDEGQTVGSGIYIFHIAAPHTTLSGKMVLIK